MIVTHPLDHSNTENWF